MRNFIKNKEQYWENMGATTDEEKEAYITNVAAELEALLKQNTKGDRDEVKSLSEEITTKLKEITTLSKEL